MKVSLTFNKQNKDGFYPVMLTLVDCGKRRYLNTQVAVMKKFKKVEEMCADEADYEVKRSRLMYLMYQANMYVGNLLNQLKDFDMQCEEIRSMLQLPLPNRGGEVAKIKAEAKVRSVSVLAVMDNFIDRIEKPGTKGNYVATKNKIVKYGHGFVRFADVDREWLLDFEHSLREEGLSDTTIRQHITRLHSVFVYAMDVLDVIDSLKAFKGYKVPKKSRRPKNYLDAQMLADLRDYPLKDPALIEARDLFMLSFYLCGINASDMYDLEGLASGCRVIYQRNKTGVLIDVPCLQEAMEIVRKYKGKKNLLRYAEEGSCYNFKNRWWQRLKRIGYVVKEETKGRPRNVIYPLIEGLMPYDARRAFASIGANRGVPRDIVAKCLGHSWSQVTDVYISYDRQTIDKAVREIIDYSKSFKGRSKEEIDAEIKLRYGLED